MSWLEQTEDVEHALWQVCAGTGPEWETEHIRVKHDTDFEDAEDRRSLYVRTGCGTGWYEVAYTHRNQPRGIYGYGGDKSLALHYFALFRGWRTGVIDAEAKDYGVKTRTIPPTHMCEACPRYGACLLEGAFS